MRKKLGMLLMILGTLLLIGAMSLLLWNQKENKKAEEMANEVLSQMIEETESYTGEIEDKPLDLYEETMPEKIIDGRGYIGYLTIPALGLQLPVMSEWDYARLRVAPCRYYGSTVTDNLVIAAHNYASHFGRLKDIKIGDNVVFVNVEGRVKEYQVVEVNILEPTDVEKMTDGEFELSLFTCTYGGKSRLTIGCSEIM